MSFDDELLDEFVVEANEHLADIENQLLSIEAAGKNFDIELVNEVFRGIHSIKGAAGFLGMTKLNDLAHSLENILNMLRTSELVPNPAIIDVMLRSADRLKELVNDIHNSNDADISNYVDALEQITTGEQPEAPCDTSSFDKPAPVNCTDPDPQDLRTGTDSETTKPSTPAASPAPPEASIRVPVNVLDRLMNLAGELVLSRNQLLQAIATQTESGIAAITSRLDQITNEVQHSITQTRMQQIGTVFSKFPRIVRDLSSRLGKQCGLEIEGSEVEVDKTIIEAVGDPLTHLIRNSVDHGIEMPTERKQLGKASAGKILLRAFYEAGKVRIEIKDDGAGIEPHTLKEKAIARGVITAVTAEQMSDREALRLIFHPGFSTATEVTDVSGRGVGMDVVMTNIANLGGTVDVESIVGAGTKVIVTLPLTLAIIPSLIVHSGDDRFAIPQGNIAELVRVQSEEHAERIGLIKNSEILRLREHLLPLIRLEDAIRGEERSGNSTSEQTPPLNAVDQTTNEATNIVVLETSQHRFGLVVDRLHDSEEIVVKPLGRHIRDCPCLSGATILGDGHIALILDVIGLASHEQIQNVETTTQDKTEQPDPAEQEEAQFVLLFDNHPDEHFAVSMEVVSRIERICSEQIDTVGGHELLQLRNETIPLLRLENHISARPTESNQRTYVVVFEIAAHEIGLIVPTLGDIRELSIDIDTVTLKERGVIGSMVLAEQTTRYIDLFELAEMAYPDWFVDCQAISDGASHSPRILLAEDSTFFRNQVAETLRQHGYEVIACQDGRLAWECLTSGKYEFDIVVTDIEMPNMDGFELSRRIKQAEQWSWLPVIALTSLAGSSDIQRSFEAGMDDYQIKMDRDKLLDSLRNFTGVRAGNSHTVLQSETII